MWFFLENDCLQQGLSRGPVFGRAYRSCFVQNKTNGFGLFAGLLAVVTTGIALANNATSEEINLALGKPYTLTPAPSYKTCTDADDRVQLTDGVKAGAYWTKKSTVGWNRNTEGPIVITIDLQQIEPIEEIRFYGLGGGRAEVFFPSLLVFMVSDDGKEFYIVRTVNSHGLEPKGVAPKNGPTLTHTFRATGLRTCGRYVRIIPYPKNKSFVFLDEVEIIQGRHDPKAVLFDPQDRFISAKLADLFAAHRTWLRARDELDQLDEVLAEKQGKQPDQHLTDRRKSLADCLQEANELPVYRPERLQKMQARLQTLRGEWLASKWNRPLLWKQANPMEQTRPNDVFFAPPREDHAAEIELWQREYEPLAVTLVNCSPNPLRFEVAVSLIKNRYGQTFDPHRAITLRQAWYVETRPEGELIGDALIKITDGRLPLEAGCAGQLWLTFYDPDLPPGRYSFGIRLRNTSAPPEQETIIPVNVTVHPLVFPERVALRSYNWAYLSRMQLAEGLHLTDEQVRWVVRDLKSHYTNVFMLSLQALPVVQIQMGSLRMDFRQHDRVLDYYPDAEFYLFLSGCSPDQPDGFGRGRWGPYMSDSWKRFFESYLNQWVDHLAQRGIGYDRFALYPYDESLCDNFLQLAKFIKEVDPQIQVFANHHGRLLSKEFTEIDLFADYIAIWCLSDSNPQTQMIRQKLKRSVNKEVWRYAAKRFAQSFSPYTYYRLQLWRAWAAGEVGCGFWVYITWNRRDSWDDFASEGKGCFDVVYTGRDAPIDSGGEVFIPSRRWEIWREGVEDYQYLHTLSERIRTAREQGAPAQLVREAEAVLERMVVGVLEPGDQPALLYDARRQLTQAILRLDGVLGMTERSR